MAFFGCVVASAYVAYLSLSTITGLRTTQILKDENENPKFESVHLRKRIYSKNFQT